MNNGKRFFTMMKTHIEGRYQILQLLDDRETIYDILHQDITTDNKEIKQQDKVIT